MDFDEAIDRFKDNMEFVRNMSSNTVESYLTDLQHFKKYLLDHDLDYTQVKRRQIEAFVKELSQGRYSTRKPSPSTVSRNLSTIRSY